jgi:hypothetical protein
MRFTTHQPLSQRFQRGRSGTLGLITGAEPGTLLNVSKKFIVSHLCPPDSSQPFLVNGSAYQYTLPLYLILEMVMTGVRLSRRLC